MDSPRWVPEFDSVHFELYNQGGWTLNAGTCPSVGIGGIALGGGFGLLGRKFGLLMDRITEMQVVDAMGECSQFRLPAARTYYLPSEVLGGGSLGWSSSLLSKP